MEKYETKQLVRFMKSLYPNMKGNEKDITESWDIVFRDFDLETVKNAILSLTNEKTYIPNVAEILSRAKDSFTVNTMKLGGGKRFVIFVVFPGSKYSFDFSDKEEANSFLDMLRSKPTQKRIAEMHDSKIERKIDKIKEACISM